MVLELVATALPTVVKNAILGVILGLVLVVGYYILKRQGHDLLASFKARAKVSPAVQVAPQGTQKIPIRITQADEGRVVLVLGSVRLTVEAIQDEV